MQFRDTGVHVAVMGGGEWGKGLAIIISRNYGTLSSRFFVQHFPYIVAAVVARTITLELLLFLYQRHRRSKISLLACYRVAIPVAGFESRRLGVRALELEVHSCCLSPPS